MKAILHTRYGGPQHVLHLEEVEKPAPKDDEVLVEVRAASVNAADWHLLRGDPFLLRLGSGLLKPKNKIPGADVAGRVEAVGRNVMQFRPGDEVFGDISGCGWSAFSEYVSVPENVLALKPPNISFEEAAAVPMAAVTALQGIRYAGGMRPGQKVLINGASGGVGTFALQLAKAFGAEVTGVCSTRNLDMLRSIGADHVIDYTKEDFTQNGQQYDLIIGTNGHRSLTDYKRALSPGGIYVCTGGTMAQIFQSMLLGPLMSRKGGKKMGNMGVAKPDQNDLALLAELLEAGKVKPVIDRRYPLSEVPEALRYLEEGHAQGKIVITVEPNSK